MKALNEIDRKKEIKRELISKDLTEYLKKFITTILVCGLFGILGCLYSKDNNEDLVRGAVFGTIFPLGIMLLRFIDEFRFTSFGKLPYIIYVIAWICFSDSIPYRVGVGILCFVICVFIIYFVYIETKNRTKEVDEIYSQENKIIKVTPYKETYKNEQYSGIFDNSETYDTPEELYSMNKKRIDTEEISFIDDEESLDYECERCFKKISYEEWELYDMMCEDCFTDVHTDEKGNYHDEEIF